MKIEVLDEDLRLRVEQIVLGRQESRFDETIESIKGYLLVRNISSQEDLNWWPWSGHNINVDADILSVPLYMLYKNIIHASKVDLDAGIHPRPVFEILSMTAFDSYLGWFLTLKLDCSCFQRSSSKITTCIRQNLPFWKGEDESHECGLKAFSDLLHACRDIDPKSIVRWILDFGFLHRGVHLPFVPFLNTQEVSPKWLKHSAESIRPYALAIAGIVPIELCCHWSSNGSQLIVIPRES
jgi:hypothetical protein